MAINRNVDIITVEGDIYSNTVDLNFSLDGGFIELELSEAKQLRKELKAAIKVVEDAA